MIFVRVSVNVPAVGGEFDYHLPPELESLIGVGHLVRVPFGAQNVQAVVTQILEQPAVSETRMIQELLDPLPVLTQAQIELARQLSETNLNSMATMIELMLPVGLSQHADVLYSLSEQVTSQVIFQTFSEIQKRLVVLLEARGPLRGRQIDRHFQHLEWRKSAQVLFRQKFIQQQSILPPPSVRPKLIRTAQLAVSPEQAELAMPTLGKTPATLDRRQKALRFLIHEQDAVAVAWVYAESGCNLADLQDLVERELIILLECEIFRDPLGKFGVQNPIDSQSTKIDPVLTPEQAKVLSEVMWDFLPQADHPENPRTAFLLYGVTGSGKTEIYLQATTEAIRQGKSAIILVPEIAITPQIVRRFLAHFPGQVGLVHSKLSDGERYDTWRRARAGQLKVIIGPRSALFTPLPNPGLIVVDECHDNSYFQSEPPFYHAVKAAETYARTCGAVCILGSATPTLDQRYRSLLTGVPAQQNGLRRLELTRRFQTRGDGGKLGELPAVMVVDMREELKSGNQGIFSRMLLEALAETLGRGEQAILYLNRRGTATYVFCRDCGHVFKCPHCDTPLTYHVALPIQPPAGSRSSPAGLLCHHCDYTRQMPRSCPECSSSQVRAYGLGSEKVESELKLFLPSARVLRWDWETTREKDAHEMILMHFANHQADVLVGTQMLAKGLDLPLVTLVGIIQAEVGLSLPDPFAGERTFQLLTQVAGRAGRSVRGGKVIMQTFMPENPVIQMAAGHDFDRFYHWELENRRSLGYPPFARLMRLEYRHRNSTEAELQARALSEKLKQRMIENQQSQTSLIGPVPCFFVKLNDEYRWQLIVRGPNPAALLQGRIPAGWRVEVEPVSLL